jgi:hypothetical protein
MPSRLLRLTLLTGALAIPAAVLPTATPQGRPPAPERFFEQKIRPVLTDTCLKCHGGQKVRGGLRLVTRAALLKGGEHGPALVPGDPERSLLIRALRYAHEDIKMPPGKPLPDAAVRDFVAWVKAGAPWPENVTLSAGRADALWAFAPVRDVAPPDDPDGWSDNPIDRFVRDRLRQRGLKPAGPADCRTLIRRATFDLTGLPPTPEEVAAFLSDRAPDAYERLVERLLASPHYAERWARHWLDAARYADTGGFEADHFYPGAWRYRDYVLRALAADKPLDRFLQEQVAGDELWPDDPEAVQATALFGVGPAQEDSAMVPDRLEYDWLTDAADTTGAVFLGLTLGCARCHDHKYDPIAQKDYFGLQAVFAASDRPFPAKIRLARIKSLNGLLSERPVPKDLLNDPRCTVRAEDDTGLRLFHRAAPLPVRLLHRGELSKPGEVVAPAIPAALRPAAGGPRFAGVPATGRRAALARWLTAPDNPLTARVLVNRVWGWHFGQGLVRTPNDFGAQGEPPTHPELLDWLARDLVRHGWGLKHLHRRILLSRTYRMSSIADCGLRIADSKDNPQSSIRNPQSVDPENRLLWHFPRRRLEGETVRDALLACAGTLNRKAFGPAVVPPLERDELTGLFGARTKWPVTKDAAEHTRRSVYLLVRRTFTYPLFAAFDPPEVMTSCARRLQTTVPTQALALLNSPLARAQSAAFARRLLREGGPPVERAWLLAFGRAPTAAEAERARAFLQARTAAHGGEREPAVAELCLALFNANEFLYVD